MGYLLESAGWLTAALLAISASFSGLLETQHEKTVDEGSTGRSEGWWGVADSTVDWCEEDYAVSPYVAEWWNTLSSLWFIYVGVCGAALTFRWATREVRYTLSSLVLALIGVGSVYFHASMLRKAQACDELPMLYALLCFLYALLEPQWGKRMETLGIRLFGIGVLMTLAYVLFPRLYTFFMIVYLFTMGYTLYKTAQRCGEKDCHPLAARLSFISRCMYAAAYLCWLVDHMMCGIWPFFDPQLHAWWHLLAGLGTYLHLLFLVADRAAHFGRLPRVAWLLLPFPLPYVEFAAKQD